MATAPAMPAVAPLDDASSTLEQAAGILALLGDRHGSLSNPDPLDPAAVHAFYGALRLVELAKGMVDAANQG